MRKKLLWAHLVTMQKVYWGKKPHNTYPNNHLRTEKSGGNYASFVAMLHFLHSIADR